jgi:hypothetical protein
VEPDSSKDKKFQTTLRLSPDEMERLRAWGVERFGEAFSDFSVTQQLKKFCNEHAHIFD